VGDRKAKCPNGCEPIIESIQDDVSGSSRLTRWSAAIASPRRSWQCQLLHDSLDTVVEYRTWFRNGYVGSRYERVNSCSVPLHPVLDLARPYMIVPVIARSAAS
jgi:hypothetical protein